MSNADEPAFPVSANDRENYEAGGYVPKGVFGLTKREYAAIALRVPSSGDDEIDAMIHAANRKDFAAMAMQGYIADGYPGTFDAAAIARVSAAKADALRAELERTK